MPHRGLLGSVSFQAIPNGSHFFYNYTQEVSPLPTWLIYLPHLINDKKPFSTANIFFIILIFTKIPE